MKSVIVSVPLAGYETYWRPALQSQERYAAVNGYRYITANRPATIIHKDETAWVKLWVLRALLERGWDTITFLDADCEIRPGAPPLTEMLVDGKDVHMAIGASGRPNSGMIMLRNTPRSQAFIDAIIASCGKPVSSQDDAPWENGQVIAHAKNNDAVAIVQKRWNNSIDPALDDWIRHYTGVMRSSYQPAHPRRDSSVLRLYRAIRKVNSLIRLGRPLPPLEERMPRTAARVLAALNDPGPR